MKKSIVIVTLMMCLVTFTFAYTPTDMDQAIIDGFTDKIEKIIDKKWESKRKWLVAVVKSIAWQWKTNPQMKFILNKISDNLSGEETVVLGTNNKKETTKILQDKKWTTYTDASGFSCGAKKYCKHMTSCTEASYYYNVCGLKNLDRDGDGIYCENVCK